jgi:long-chain acyl-CoA synthetase
LHAQPPPRAYWVSRICVITELYFVLALGAGPWWHNGTRGSITEDQVTSAVIEERAAVQAQAGARTLCELLAATATSHGDLPAYSDRDGGAAWQTLTWRELAGKVLTLAAALVRLGLKPGERVALMLPNRIEHVLADLAVLHAGGVPVTFYATLASDQIGYLATDCDVRLAVLDGESQLARWQPLLASLPGVAKVIVRDGAACPADERYLSWSALESLGDAAGAEEVGRRVAAIDPDDPVTLLSPGHDGQSQGRRDHPPQRAVRVRHREDRRLPDHGWPVGLLPAARSHRRADADDLPGHLRRWPLLFLPRRRDRPDQDRR